MTTPQRDAVDYNRLLQRLVAYSCVFMGIFLGDADLRVIDGIGKSPADFATDAILLFLDEQISCSGDENAIFACLKRVVQNDILDARGSAAVKTTDKVEPVSGKATGDGKVLKGLDDYPHRDAVDLQVEGTEFKRRLYEQLEYQEPELYELVYAIFEENALTPRAIAEIIKTDADDVQNRKKRLRTFLVKKKIIKVARASK